jgi:hypothetical protein
VIETEVKCAGCSKLKVWAETAWNRGHERGMAANRQIALETQKALAVERESAAKTNAMLTDALLKAEEQRDVLKAALLKALEVVAKYDPAGAARWLRENG